MAGRVDELLINFLIREAIRMPDGTPMMGHEAVDAETGAVHPTLLEAMVGASATRISMEGVWVERYMTRGELAGLLAEEGGQ